MRWRRILLLLALCGWLGASVSQLVSMRTSDEQTLERWTVRRNQFLLLSSLCANTLALSVASRYVKKFKQRADDRE